VYQGFSLITGPSLLTSTKKSIIGFEAIWVGNPNTLKSKLLEKEISNFYRRPFDPQTTYKIAYLEEIVMLLSKMLHLLRK